MVSKVKRLLGFLGLCVCSWQAGQVQAQESRLSVFSTELRRTETELHTIRTTLSGLVEPLIGDTADQLGAHGKLLTTIPLYRPYLQVDLGESLEFDSVALIPAVKFTARNFTPYAFPRKIRLDVSDDFDFREGSALLVEAEVTDPGLFPVLFPSLSGKGRYVRLTILEMPEVDNRWTFALSEMMILKGNRNLAADAPVVQNSRITPNRRWRTENLTDGRTPLGAPVDSTKIQGNGLGVWGLGSFLGVDLGIHCPIDEIRLYPRLTKEGADLVSYKFPVRFRVEVAASADMQNKSIVFDTGENDFSDPGHNPVTFRCRGLSGRFVRVVSIPDDVGRSFGLSQIAVYSGNENVALGKKTLYSKLTEKVDQAEKALTNGYSSQGKILELPEWFSQLKQRQLLRQKEADLEGTVQRLREETAHRIKIGLWILGTLGLSGAGIFFWLNRRRRQILETEFREQLARDMHDEVGSNLAGIAVVSELASREDSIFREDWREIHQIALETTDAMREVLWVVGVRQAAGIDPSAQIKKAAQRILKKQEVCWANERFPQIPERSAEFWRQIYLFFKECIANVNRHAEAKRVVLSADIIGKTFVFEVTDDGRGFDSAKVRKGVGLASLKQRARNLGGKVQIESAAAKGTSVTLRVPLPPEH